MGNYRKITNQQKHPKRNTKPEKKHIHRVARLPKSLWFSHTWVVITFIAISQSTTTTFIGNWKPYKTLGYYCVASYYGKNESVITDIIKYRYGIFQGDTLSVLLFMLCLNPLSFSLQNLKGYSYDKSRNHTLTHNFFVDDLKFYASSISILKKQLDHFQMILAWNLVKINVLILK